MWSQWIYIWNSFVLRKTQDLIELSIKSNKSPYSHAIFFFFCFRITLNWTLSKENTNATMSTVCVCVGNLVMLNYVRCDFFECHRHHRRHMCTFANCFGCFVSFKCVGQTVDHRVQKLHFTVICFCNKIGIESVDGSLMSP